MKLPFKALAFCLLINSYLIGQNNKVYTAPVPSWVNTLPDDTTILFKPDEISRGYLFLLYDNQRNYSAHTQYSHYRIKIVSEAGIQDESNLSVSFAPSYQTLTFHSIKVIRGRKEINLLKPNSFKVVQAETERERYMYNGRLSADYDLPDIRKGDIIDYSYSICGDNPVFKNRFYDDIVMQFGVPVCKIYHRLLLPPGKTIQIKNINTQVKCAASNSGNEYVWSTTHVSVPDYDDDAPSWYETYGYVQLTEYKSWNELALWAAEIFKYDDNISPELDNKIKGLRKQNPNDKDFVLACVRFVQDEIRYVGIEIGPNSQQPYAPSLVFNQRFGDCKDKSLLLCTMLRKAGFSADPALVHSSSKQMIRNWLPSPSDFDHCIAKLKIGAETYWIDPTETLHRGNLDNEPFPLYRTALVVNGSVKDLETIPEKYVTRTETTESYSLGDTNSESILTVTTKYYGEDANRTRNYLANESRIDVEKSYRNFYAATYSAISALDTLKIYDDENSNVITTIENYRIDSIWETSDDVRKASFYASNLRHELNTPQTKIRKTPIGITYPDDFTQIINITIFKPWNISNIDHTIRDSCFEFVANSTHTDNSIRLYYHYKTLKDAVAPDLVTDYLKKVNEVKDDLGYGFTTPLKHNAGTAGNDRIAINWLMVFIVALFSLLCLLLFQSIYKKDFKTISGQNTRTIGGLIIFPLIGLFVTPISLAIWLFRNNIYFDLARWTALTNISSSSYNPGLSGLLIYELIGNIFTGFFAVFLITMLFKKRTTLPILMVIFYAFHFVFMVSDYYIAYALTSKVSDTSTSSIARAFFACVLWIPFFLISQRVKETFTKTFKQNTIPPETENISST